MRWSSERWSASPARTGLSSTERRGLRLRPGNQPSQPGRARDQRRGCGDEPTVLRGRRIRARAPHPARRAVAEVLRFRRGARCRDARFLPPPSRRACGRRRLRPCSHAPFSRRFRESRHQRASIAAAELCRRDGCSRARAGQRRSRDWGDRPHRHGRRRRRAGPPPGSRPIRDGDTVQTLRERVHEAEYRILPRAVRLMEARFANSSPVG